LFFSLPKGSKNSLPGFADPARGDDKKLRMILLVDGTRISKTIGEYDPFYICSGNSSILDISKSDKDLPFDSLTKSSPWITTKKKNYRKRPTVRTPPYSHPPSEADWDITSS